MKPGILKRIAVVLMFIPACVFCPVIGLAQYILYGRCADKSPWAWLLDWGNEA